MTARHSLDQTASKPLCWVEGSPDAIREIAAYVRDLEERLAKAAEALEDILAPIAKAQRELEPGQRLNGSAYTILTSAESLREIARTALSQIRSEK